MEIRAVEVTGSRVGDAPRLPEPPGQIPAEEPIGQVAADGACDARACCAAILARQACPAIPTRRNGQPWKETTPGARARDETLRATPRLGRSIRKRGSRHRLRGRVEAKMRRLELLGERLMARDLDRQTAELPIPIAILNRFTQLATPETMRVP